VTSSRPLSGRHGIVTGGSSGIGAATSKHLAELGADVAVIARHPGESLRSPVDGLGKVVRIAADVTDYDGLSAAFTRCRIELGELDFVIVCAGTTEQGSILEGQPAAWRSVLATNLLGAAYTARMAMAAFDLGRRTDLVLIGSVAGRHAYAGEPAYIASKWGVVGLARVLRLEGAARGVRVTLIEPGLVDTPMTHTNAQMESWLAAVEPLSADDVAEAVGFVLSQPPHVAVNELLIRPLRQLT
jgi:NADP-dependent 3-hydroxy acid dehydrogenase YdfG